MVTGVLGTGAFPLAKVYDCPEDFFAKYKVTREKVLGHGMSGEVVLVHFDDDSEDKRALKIFTRSKIDISFFLTEVVMLQRVKHSNIMTGITAFKCPDHFIIDMPYCSGGSLRHHLERLSKRRVFKYFLQLCSALLYLHVNDIAHRDVKPDNVLLDKNDDVILIDFGLACRVTSGSGKIVIAGTQGYMPPELSVGKDVNLYKCDLYALGVVLWNMVFEGMAPASTDYLERVDKVKHLLPVSIHTFLHNLLQPDPDARWDDTQLVNALYAFPEVAKMADKLWGHKT